MHTEKLSLAGMENELKRIAIVITRSDFIGGAHVHVRDCATELIRRGLDVRVFAGGHGPFAKDLEERGIAYEPLVHLARPIRPYQDVRAYRELKQALLRFGPQLVSTHSSKAGWLGRLAARNLGIPGLFTAHGWAFTEGVPHLQRWAYMLAERIAGAFTSHVITVSEYDRRIALQHRVVEEHRLTTVHNGMSDVDISQHATPEREKPVVVMVARFEEQKDHDTLLKALAMNRDLPWTLELIGDGPRRLWVERLVTQLGIQDRVSFLGVRNDVALRLASAQIFALSSRWEGFPLSILEAMRAGLPVVATNVGGVAEAVSHKKTGFVVPPKDAGAFAACLRALLEHSELRSSMGRAARMLFLERFTFERMLEKNLAIYRSLV